MPLVVGIDEAGYGPRLGPLVVGCSIWEVSPEAVGGDFWSLLKKAVCRPGRRDNGRLIVGDSKLVFDRNHGPASLERQVLAFAHATGATCGCLADFVAAVCDAAPARRSQMPWYADLARPLPTDRARGAFEGAAERLSRCMSAAGVRCRALLARLMPEDHYNDRLSATGNKAAVLLEPMLDLLQEAGRHAGDGELHVIVDRLGGRADYRRVLMTAFPQRHLHELSVAEDDSRYRLSAAAPACGDWYVQFTVDADQHYLPVALASMLAKYLRELLMEKFNAYWRRYAPEIRPTAGYYNDADRFLQEIAPVLMQSGLTTERFVRQW